MILDHSVASEEDFLTEVKRRKFKTSEAKISQSRISLSNMADYDFYESSTDMLRQGFYATKYNYSNMEKKQVYVRLSTDE